MHKNNSIVLYIYLYIKYIKVVKHDTSDIFFLYIFSYSFCPLSLLYTFHPCKKLLNIIPRCKDMYFHNTVYKCL